MLIIWWEILNHIFWNTGNWINLGGLFIINWSLFANEQLLNTELRSLDLSLSQGAWTI